VRDALAIPSVSIVNLKGGVGKTALTVNLAFALAEWHGWSVLVVDIDPQFNTTQHLLHEKVIVNQLSGRTVKDILDPPPPVVSVGRPQKQKRAAPKSFIKEVAVKGPGHLALLPSLLDLSFVNRNPSGKEGRLELFLRTIADDYNIILIDCPPTTSVLTHAAFNASRYYLIPVTPDYFAPIGIPLIEEEVSYFRDNLHAPTGEMTPLGIVYTIVDRRWHADWRPVARRVQQATDIEPYATHFSTSKYWRDCAASHEPVYRKHKGSVAEAQLRSFTEEFMERLDTAEGNREQ
jgi:chromosome partitioning protein